MYPLHTNRQNVRYISVHSETEPSPNSSLHSCRVQSLGVAPLYSLGVKPHAKLYGPIYQLAAQFKPGHGYRVKI